MQPGKTPKKANSDVVGFSFVPKLVEHLNVLFSKLSWAMWVVLLDRIIKHGNNSFANQRNHKCVPDF